MFQYQFTTPGFRKKDQHAHSAVSSSSDGASTMPLVTTRNRRDIRSILPSDLRLHEILDTTITETERSRMRERMGQLRIQAIPTPSLFRRIRQWVSSFFHTTPLPPLSTQESLALKRQPLAEWVRDKETLARVIGTDDPISQLTQENRASYYVLLTRLQGALSQIDDNAQQLLCRSSHSLKKPMMDVMLRREDPKAGECLVTLQAIKARDQRRVADAKAEAISHLILQFQQATQQLHSSLAMDAR